MRFGESHKSLIFSYISQLCIFLYLSVIHIAHTYLSEIWPVPEFLSHLVQTS